MEATRLVVEQPNEFYAALARGVEYAASIYGGEDYAMALSGNEMPGYHTGPAAHLGVLIGSRHSHLDNAGYSIDQKVLSKKHLSPGEVAEALLEEERHRQVLSSLVICYFARALYEPPTILAALRQAGLEFDPDGLHQIGGKIHREKYRFKVREGFSFDKLRLSKRLFETKSPVGVLDEDFMRRAVEHVKKSVTGD